MLIHVIQSGENLWLLSRRYGVSIDEIVAANELPDANRLTVGQALVIPLPSRHIVRPGDNLWQIARLYGTTVQALQQINRIPNPYMIQPGQVIQIPAKRKPTIDVNAFTIQFDEAGAQEVRDIGRHLTYLTPFGYRIQRDGSLEAVNDTLLIQAAEQTQVVPIMAITNFSATELGSEVAHIILSSTELQDKLLTNIIDTMRSKKYQGLNVDFENVRPADRELYNQFLRRAVERLHAEHYFVSTSVAPKTSKEQKGLLYEAHDYEAQGEIVDFIVLMTYEWGYRFGPPQAISPIDQIRAVLNYATRVIPSHKLLMGFQLYARDWLLPHVQGQEAETFSVQEAFRRAVQHGAAIQYDAQTQSPYFRYTDEQGRNHEVWFEDARSAQAKFNLVKTYNLKGISYWVLGYPFPQNWLLLEDNFRVRKL
ncbi:LysM peptidoglycan-binding domain-containing protein [Paenibacillus allorhizosphaerae]|uniref:Cortical-lytic enzyme n=1 Tax=Paenibacillus allorhizosphaerae TaxID=2849866 RepID=A0ABN7TDC2_9BACL|nr:LysM peptidoglycan-binding domain-containing protein [Paenibacillus allorhizosphaerae]CAG7624596.1 Cortical fragment-lytic enzyme [Paenibacillus allorhizosphaerae]